MRLYAVKFIQINIEYHLSPFLVCCYSETEEVTLRIVMVSIEDSGVYACVATNVAGSVTSSANLTVSGKRPEIVSDFWEPLYNMVQKMEQEWMG